MAEENPGGNAGNVPDSGADEVGASVIVEPGSEGSNAGTRTLPAAAMKFADLTESGSESGDNEAEEPVAAGPDNTNATGEPGTSASATEENGSAERSSPPPNCAICLSRCRRKCFTDSCMHQFCFKCLCEWSKIKPECPLCKQPFRTIIHNVRTLDDYDRYPVQTSSPVPTEHHPSLRYHIVRRPRYMPLVQNQAVMTNDIEAGIAGGAAGEEVLPAAEVAAGRHSYSRFEPYRVELMNYYRHDQDAATSGSLSQLWRRYVYDRKLYALPVSDSLTGHFREWSARFYRNNPAQMHRLMPWIHRDIMCLLRNAAHSVNTVMTLMNDILPMSNILGPTFRRRLSPFLGGRTSHFIHELFNFARSPFDMIGYDHVVQYSARVAEEVEVDLLDMVETQSSNGDDLQLEVGDSDADAVNADFSADWSPSRVRPSTSVIVTNPGATHSFSVTMASDGSELPGISIRRTTTSNVGSQTVAINLSMRRPAAVASEEAEVIEIDDGDAAANAEVAAINDGSNTSRRHAGASLPVSVHIELQSSSSSGDDDECVFVLELKPPHLRTPEQVSLDSNSDSDVVFVNEQNEAAPPASVDDRATHSPVDPASRDQGLFMGPSTSGAAANRGKNWKLVMAEARRLDQLRTLRSTRSKRSRQRSSMPARSDSGSSNNSSSSSSSFHFSSSSDEDSSASSTTNSEPPKKKSRKPVPKKKRSKKVSNGKRTSRKRKPKDQNVEPELSHEQLAMLEQQRQVAQQQKSQQKPQQQPESSSDSPSSSDDESGGDSSASSGQPKTNNNNSSSDSDDDSTVNLQLSALRATLKAEATLEDRKPLKLELQLPDDEHQQEVPHNSGMTSAPREDTEPGCSVPKRRRSCSHSNQSSQSASLASSSTATSSSGQISSFGWEAVVYSGDPLMRGNPAMEEHDIANSLIELSTLTRPVEIGLFNEHSNSSENSIGMLRNTICGSPQALAAHDTNLDIYFDRDTGPDASNERDGYSVEAAIDVVGEAELEATEDTATATEEQDEEDDEDEDQGEDDQEEEKAAEEEEEEDDDSDNHDEEKEYRGLLPYLA